MSHPGRYSDRNPDLDGWLLAVLDLRALEGQTVLRAPRLESRHETVADLLGPSGVVDVVSVVNLSDEVVPRTLEGALAVRAQQMLCQLPQELLEQIVGTLLGAR